MQDKKVQYVDMAVGYSKASYFLSLGGLSKDALINDAKRSMYMSYKLKPGITFENITLDIKTTYIWPYSVREVFIVSDIAKGDTSSTNVTYSDNYLKLLSGIKYIYKSEFEYNESVICFDPKTNEARNGKLIRLFENGATVFFVNSKSSFQVKNAFISNIFKISDTESLSKRVKFSLNQKVKFSIALASGQEKKFEGIIEGLNATYALVNISDHYLKVAYKKLQ